MNLNTLLKQIVALIGPLLPFLGQGALEVVERGATVPQADIKKLMKGASPEDTAKAIELGRIMADAVSDFAVFVASKGQIEPD